MLFQKKPRPPLEQAARLVQEAVEVAYQYKRDRGYRPTPDDLAAFERLATLLWESHTTVRYIARCMGQRSRGEPEGAKKWHDPTVADYHLPS